MLERNAKTVLVAGFQHETNTFAPTKATYSNFVNGEGHPGLPRGNDMLALRDVNLPMGGFIRSAESAGWRVLPTVWAGASPSSYVTDDAYERIAEEILEVVARREFDAIYLDLHGAMATESFDDGEGELLRRIRRIVGPTLPVVASLDLHANVTDAMLANASALVAYRTYPHVDMAETGSRTADLLKQIFEGERDLSLTVRRLPFLIPINSMCTLVDPSRSMYQRLSELEVGGVFSLSFTLGFPAADFPECGPVIWGYGQDDACVEGAVSELYETMLRNERQWAVELLTPTEAVSEAMRIASELGPEGPVVIADTQDNPGGGADSNTTGMLRALVEADAQDAAVGLIWDPEAATLAHRAGIGQSVELTLGGKTGIEGDVPFSGRFEVVALSDGSCRYDGPMMHGMTASLGPVACVRIGGVNVVLSSTKAQMYERNLYRMAGIQPEKMKILVNKSSVHFRADFQAISRAVLVAKAPGPLLADAADLPWKRLRDGIRLKPMGKPFVAP